MSFIDKMKEAGEDIKEAFQDGATIWPIRRAT